jgi:hypothetical protein
MKWQIPPGNFHAVVDFVTVKIPDSNKDQQETKRQRAGGMFLYQSTYFVISTGLNKWC